MPADVSKPNDAPAATPGPDENELKVASSTALPTDTVAPFATVRPAEEDGRPVVLVAISVPPETFIVPMPASESTLRAPDWISTLPIARLDVSVAGVAMAAVPE